MRICFTSDLHGRDALYEQLSSHLLRERPRLLILGGDLFPDGDLEDPLGTQGRYLEESFLHRVSLWRRQIQDMQVAVILGNHDWQFSESMLREASAANTLRLLTLNECWRLDGVNFTGYSRTPPTPYWVKDFERLDLRSDSPPESSGAVWNSMRHCAEDAEVATHFSADRSMEADFRDALIPASPWIFVCHAPPVNSKLDQLPHIDYPVGSHAVRAFIEQRRPTISLHGHIHESPACTGAFWARVGETLAINPGQGVDRLQAVFFDSDKPLDTLRHTVFS